METKEYIENRINTKIREYDGLSKKYHRAHVGMMIALFCCLFVSVILHVLYLILPIIWFILGSVVLVLASLFLLFFDVLNSFSDRAASFKYQATMLSYEKNLYLGKENEFADFAYRCERFM